jgi:hypothetical protein
MHVCWYVRCVVHLSVEFRGQSWPFAEGEGGDRDDAYKQCGSKAQRPGAGFAEEELISREEGLRARASAPTLQ